MIRIQQWDLSGREQQGRLNKKELEKFEDKSHPSKTEGYHWMHVEEGEFNQAVLGNYQLTQGSRKGLALAPLPLKCLRAAPWKVRHSQRCGHGLHKTIWWALVS